MNARSSLNKFDLFNKHFLFENAAYWVHIVCTLQTHMPYFLHNDEHRNGTCVSSGVQNILREQTEKILFNFFSLWLELILKLVH